MAAKQLVSVRIDRQLWKDVRKLAIDSGVTAAQAVEDALGYWVERVTLRSVPRMMEQAIRKAEGRELTYDREDA